MGHALSPLKESSCQGHHYHGCDDGDDDDQGSNDDDDDKNNMILVAKKSFACWKTCLNQILVKLFKNMAYLVLLVERYDKIEFS